MPSGSDIRVPPRALSAAKQGRAERPGAAGSPAGAEEVHSLPTQPGTENHRYERAPHEVIVWGSLLVLQVQPCFPEAPSGCRPGRSPQRSKEERSVRVTGAPA